VAARGRVHDFAVIGGGILGMSTALALQRAYSGSAVLLLEKESSAAQHQTGRNSGVIHAGVYYAPGSLKARFCKEGNRATKEFCREHDVPFDECGKLLVATNAVELERMHALVKRCGENGIDIEVLDERALREIEPNVVGVGAFLVPSTGIVSYARIAERMGELVQANGGTLLFDHPVTAISESSREVRVHTTPGAFSARYLVACAGLQSDRVSRMLGLNPDFQIIPFRG